MVSWSKWNKYKFLKQSSGLVPHLPSTRWMDTNALWSMLDSHGKVILKPSAMSGGYGVILVSALGHGKYQVHFEKYVKVFQSKQTLTAFIQKKINKNYIVQQRIPLAQVNGCPFDLRVMVQRGKRSDWAVTGKLAKVAGKGYIVTNVGRSKGKVVPVEKAIQQSALKNKFRALAARMDTVALSTARQLSKHYKGTRTMGIDMGLAADGKLWIIEVNFAPSKSLFLQLKDKSMYRKIVAYQKR